MLDIGWTHAYWTEGPKFTALSYSDGGAVSLWPDEIGALRGLVVGTMSLGGGSAGVDAVQATGSKQPLHRASSASFNSKPIVEFNGTDHYLVTPILPTELTAYLPPLDQPFQAVIIARTRSLTMSNQFFVSHRETADSSELVGTSTLDKWRFLGNNGGADSAGNANTNAHLFRREVNNGADKLYVDETLTLDATGMNIGVGKGTGVSMAARGDGAVGTYARLDLAFVGFIPTLTAGEKVDIRSYSTSHFGTP